MARTDCSPTVDGIQGNIRPVERVFCKIALAQRFQSSRPNTTVVDHGPIRDVDHGTADSTSRYPHFLHVSYAW
ncbi:hypothetical protein PJL15_04347 [Paenarthrobacter nitroguajacolicus]|nr:hypothetical protein [Paenarthrobacter nitroguajacolicus]